MATTQSEQLQKLKEQQKDLEKKILRIEHNQLLKIGKSAKQYQLTEWHEKSLIKAFEFLKETGEDQFKEK
ncbi:hypothetical protein fh0823_23410 [Francisella halioticida]|uniref:Transposase n=1 Tax=Francisella halioticida TaxID=549298 RepID=A0ABM6M2A1_9GAMM|nr:hypothetical protein [Francisella halioticida]ASG68923.1 hypothetical protein CDV26_11530 [Francisella halioticida]BCD92202.1 hypothetical protein fh0823_23410 [Francisella halioticida]